MIKVFQRWLTLVAPPERRARDWFLRIFVGGRAASRPSDDTFVYYLIFRTSFLVSVLLAIANVVLRSAGGNFEAVGRGLTGENVVPGFLTSYPKYAATFLLLVILPYHVVLFRSLINPRAFDLAWWRRKPLPAESMDRSTVWLLHLTGLAVVLVAMYGSFAIFALLMQMLNLENSYVFLVFCIVALPFTLAVCNYAALFVIVMLWRYSGPRTG